MKRWQNQLKKTFEIGEYCVAQYEGEQKLYSIQVKCYDKAEAPVGSTWSWPKRVDEQEMMSSKELTPLTASQAQQEI